MASTHFHSNPNRATAWISHLVVTVALVVFVGAPVALTLVSGI